MLSEAVPEGGTRLPEGLEEMPPGPELAAVLAGIDRSRLSGYDTVTVLRARARQIAYDQAELCADMVAVADRVRDETANMSTVWDSDIPKLATAEIAAALALTRRAAGNALEDAWLLTGRLPAVWRALREGAIDLPRARVFVAETRALTMPLARGVADRLLSRAPELTTGQLAHRLRRLVLEADPGAARANYELGVAERRVIHATNPDGTAYLAGHALPVASAAAAYERVDAMARAAKRAGDDRSMDQIRADVLLGLLNGSWDGPAPVHRRGVVELTVDLPTLLGLAENPAELDGWGPVIGDIARQVVRREAGAGDTIWRYSVTEPVTGRLLYHGRTLRPSLPEPSGADRRDPRRFLTPSDRAHVIARDRTCRGPGCRVPARRAEIDHIIPHAQGGPSTPSNADAKCTRCHDLKDGGWRTSRDPRGNTLWVSPLGRTYRKPPEAITRPIDLSPAEQRLADQADRPP
ncbi:HNH endonuclease [Actinomadura craniellae]|uniref:HNH endonuclease n=1 Tax=Actinomadura craniellae TaxID=2231787 RepID=A0A365GWK1_9ACTN|nr:HNH endonuclease signature motif containing protein [Actinomadura craniellae]RAY11207.1 HNH endonuclease [Actinomadura craniellae]